MRSRRLILLKSLLTRIEEPGAVAPRDRRRFDEHWRLLEHAEAHHAPSAADALAYPSIGTWLARALTAADGAALTALLDHFGAVAAAVALRAGADFTADLPAPGGVLALPGVGVLRTADAVVRLTADGPAVRPGPAGGPRDGVLLRGAGRVRGAAPGWQGLTRLPGTAAYLDDLDPYRAPPGGVGRAGLPAAPRTGDARPWTRQWRAALALLRATDPVRAAEVSALLRCLVPLGRGAGGAAKASATFRTAPGAVLTTRPGTAAGLAEVLVHEIQHSKLAVLHDLMPLHGASPEARYRVAWRPDPRPLGGVLQGTYAHLALADFWARAAHHRSLAPRARRDARARRDSCARQVAEALPVLLESAELTSAGRQFVAGMERHLVALERSDEPFSDERRAVTTS